MVMITISITDGMYLSFCIFMFYPKPLCIYAVFAHTQYGLEVVKYFSGYLKCRRLTLNKKNFLHYLLGTGESYGLTAQHLLSFLFLFFPILARLSDLLYTAYSYR